MTAAATQIPRRSPDSFAGTSAECDADREEHERRHHEEGGENTTAARILHGLLNHDQITLENGDRQAVIAALDETLEGLVLLRAVLLEENDERERVWLTSLRPGFDTAASG